ncbi:DNA-directed RNA polymerase III [Fusarium beomiforme]|uniref:DNA-directed RNA polymerase III n=1 Tax=Fusarium beomiforme TaxID=44412 RepID=A0A9P5AH13_9HYPO|nr:DNA-directed RNA polymerase III [Fusarium beomiforme]
MNRSRALAQGTRGGAAAAGSRASGESSAGSSTPAVTGTSASGTPASQSIVTTSTRGGTTTRATRAPAAGRFRPRNIRRDEAERDSLARQEEQKANERAADERKARGRSRFRSKRSRGDAMGRGGFGRVISGASGPFSSSAAGSGGRGGGGWFGGGGSGGGGGGFGGSGGRGFKSDAKPGFAQASRSREARINADKLHVHTPEEDLDSEDEAMFEALNSRAVSVLPMGIYRREHKDEGVIVATTAELEAAENAQAVPPPPPPKEEESLWVDGDADEPQSTDETTEDGGIWNNDSKTPVIKKEPGVDDSMDLDVKLKADTEGNGKQPSETPVPQTKKPKQDSEEAMIQTDLEILANELGAVEISEGEEGKTEGPSNKDGRMYLFQFPPVLPPLKQVAQPKSVNKVKPEPGESEDNVLESTSAVPDTEPVDLTNDINTTGVNVPGFEDPEQKAGFMSSLLSSGGMVGQLKVRKSGRVELDWGGSTMELSPAAGMNFLTTAVIVEENDEKPRPGVIGGESIGMGKIMGRFVLAPKWDEEEDWEVSSEDLRIE